MATAVEHRWIGVTTVSETTRPAFGAGQASFDAVLEMARGAGADEFG